MPLEQFVKLFDENLDTFGKVIDIWSVIYHPWREKHMRFNHARVQENSETLVSRLQID
jgi:hypothetical protein